MNPTVANITVRSLFRRRRFLLQLPLPLLVIGLAVLADGLGATPPEWVPPVVQVLGFQVVLPVMALIIGTGVLGSEIDDGTLVHILAKPLPRTEIILAKLVVAVLVTTVTVGVPLFAVGLVAGSTRFAIGLVAGVAVGAVAYSALFLALSVVTRRPVLIGLLYVLIWEGLLTNLLSGTRVLSVQQFVVTATDAVSGTDLMRGLVSTPVALIMASIFTVLGTAVAVDRLRSFSVAGETS
jgi:ABC-2 type transport system permease protein